MVQATVRVGGFLKNYTENHDILLDRTKIRIKIEKRKMSVKMIVIPHSCALRILQKDHVVSKKTQKAIQYPMHFRTLKISFFGKILIFNNYLTFNCPCIVMKTKFSITFMWWCKNRTSENSERLSYLITNYCFCACRRKRRI